jgi:hypothetical protein
MGARIFYSTNAHFSILARIFSLYCAHFSVFARKKRKILDAHFSFLRARAF